MKKILYLISSLLLIFTLASCNDNNDDVSLTYTNSNGEEEKIVLEETEDVSQISKVLEALGQKEKEEIVTVKSKIEGAFNISFSDVPQEEADLPKEFKLSALANIAYDKEVGLSGNVDFDMSAVEDKSYVMSLDANAYYYGIKEDADENIYLDYSLKMTDEADQAAKGKIDLPTLILIIQSGMAGGMLPDGSLGVAPSTPSLPDLSDLENLDITQLLNEFKTKFPNSSIKLNNINKDDFTLSLNISVNDILKLSGLDYSSPEDYKINLNAKISLNYGYVKELEIVKITDSKLLATILVISGAVSSNASETPEDTIARVAGYVKDFSISLKIGVEYNVDVDVKVLSDSEKSNYLNILESQF